MTHDHDFSSAWGDTAWNTWRAAMNCARSKARRTGIRRVVRKSELTGRWLVQVVR